MCHFWALNSGFQSPPPPFGLRASSFAFRMEKPPGLCRQPPGPCRQAQLEIWDYSSRPQQGEPSSLPRVHQSSSASFSRLSATPNPSHKSFTKRGLLQSPAPQAYGPTHNPRNTHVLKTLLFLSNSSLFWVTKTEFFGFVLFFLQIVLLI